MTSAEELERVQPAHELLQAVIADDAEAIQILLEDPTLSPTRVNWQDQLGWTPLIYAAFRGDFKLVKKLVNRGASVNHMALSRAGSSADGTTPLHACAAMRPSQRTTKEGFYETARVLMLAGGNPYQENLSGLTPIDVAANRNNTHMKVLLEGCALFKGVLTLPIAKLFGGKLADRYCIILPRFAWHPLGSQNGLLMRDGQPSLSLVCYKDPEDLKPLYKVPLDGARVVVEGGALAEEGFLIVKAARKQLKGLSVKSSNSSSCVVEIRSKPSSTQTAGQVLQSLAEVCKSAAVAAYCGNLGQLCEASMIEALHNLGLADGLLPLPGFQPVDKQSGMGSIAEGHPVAPEVLAEMRNTEQAPKPGRKSLSLSRLGKAAMRRFSIGDKPRQKSESLERRGSGERMSDIYPTASARQQASAQADFSRISEETPEANSSPVDWATVSRDLPPIPDAAQRRLSLHQPEQFRRPAKKDDRRHSMQSRYSDGREILVSNQGIPMDFWGGMRDQMMRRSIDGRQKLDLLSGRRQGSREGPHQPVNVRASFDVGDLDDVMNPLTSQTDIPTAEPPRSRASRVADLLDARRPADSTMQDWVQQAAEQYNPDLYEQWKRPPPSPARGSPDRGARQSGKAPAYIAWDQATNTAKRRSTSAPNVKEAISEQQVPAIQAVAPPTPPQAKSSRSGGTDEEQGPSTRSSRTGREDVLPPRADRPPLAAPAKGARSRADGLPRRRSTSSRAETAPPQQESAVTHVPQREAAVLTQPPSHGPPRSDARAPPVVNLSNVVPIHANRSDRSSGKAPRPASKNGFSSSEWFSPSSGDGDLFHWTLRPEGQKSARNAPAASQTAAAPAEKPKVDPAVARWAAEAASMVQNDPNPSAAALDELAQAGWRGSPSPQAGESPELERQPSGEKLPSLNGEERAVESEESKEAETAPSKSAKSGLENVLADGKAMQQRQAARRASKSPPATRTTNASEGRTDGAQEDARDKDPKFSQDSFFSDSSTEEPTLKQHGDRAEKDVQ